MILGSRVWSRRAWFKSVENANMLLTNKLPLKMWTWASRWWPWRTIVKFAPRINWCCGATTTATPSRAFQLFELRRLDGIPHYAPLWCHVGELLESHWPCIIIKSTQIFFIFLPPFSFIPSGYHEGKWDILSLIGFFFSLCQLHSMELGIPLHTWALELKKAF